MKTIHLCLNFLLFSVKGKERLLSMLRTLLIFSGQLVQREESVLHR